MHPAFSVIVFTVASGGGYSLLAIMGLLGALGLMPAERGIGVAGFALGFGAVSAGLLSSTLHLGHPERAWRAFSQWRSSWLSREAILALATLAPAAILAWFWVFDGRIDNLAAAATAILAGATISATAMIYASLRPVAAWHNCWTLPGYLALGLLTGASWAAFLAASFGLGAAQAASLIVALAAILSGAIKLLYWRSIDRDRQSLDAGSATGLGRFGTVRPFLSPHGEANYLMKEMGFRIARKHSLKLRRFALWGGLIAPGLLALVAGNAVGSGLDIAVLLLAALLNGAGTLVERWLFFAEAKHVVMAYYRETAD
jgi:DMSO reductase anchor subunit